MTRLFTFLQIICFLVLSINVQCQDYTWGGGNGLWNNPQNWYPAGIPQMNDEVFISKGTVYIQNGYSARAKYIEVHSTGGLKIQTNSTLIVEGSVNGEGIMNSGLVEVTGIVESNGHTGSLTSAVGFLNFGKLIINELGSYSSTACGGYAIFNEEFASCLNKGEIEVADNGSGIRNHSIFKNSGSIFIDDLDSSHGITNHGSFSNEAGASIRIQGYNSFGILSYELTSLSLTPDFVNNGKINVRNSEWWCISLVHGTFTNMSSGTISLLQSGHAGLSIDAVSTFENFGTIVSSGNTTDGIKGIGNLINRGFINSSNNGESGLYFFDIWTPEVGSVVNFGEIELYNNGDHDIWLDVELHNTDEGYIYSENLIEGAVIVNDGIFSTWYQGNHNITFENNGVVEDVYNSLLNIQNNQVVLRPLNGPLTSGVTFFNALDKASSSNTTISFGWYDQIENGNAGALYFFWSNSIYPNSFGASAPTLWLDATIQSSGQKKRLRVNILNAPLPITDNSNTKAIDNLEIQKDQRQFKIYPNPVVNSFNVDVSGNPVKTLVFKLFDVSGKEVLTKSINRSEFIDLPSNVNEGVYFGVVLDGIKVVHREKIVVSGEKSPLGY